MPSSSSLPTHGSLGYGDSYVPASGNGGYRVISYDLELDYRVASNRLAATATIEAQATHDLTRLSLDFSGLVASRVTVNGAQPTKVVATARKLTIAPATRLLQGESFTIVVRYGGAPKPLKSPWGDVGWEELTDGVIVASQPCGASSWFPCNDHPHNKASYRIRVTCDSPYTVLVNGTLTSKVRKASRTTWCYEMAQPMASYLASLQIGLYRETNLSHEPVRQSVFCPPTLISRASADFAEQPLMMEFFERCFGPYPFGEYSVVVTDDDLEIPLEAQGFSTFGRNHIDGLGSSERLIAHELAHSWFGNSVTTTTWKDIWLHEGFACYAEWLWSEESGDTSADRLARHYWNKLQALPQDLLLGDPGAALMFDDRVYKRGALFLHAIRLTLGADAFFEMLSSWATENRHGNVTTEDFYLHCQGHSERDLSSLFNGWLFAERLPALPG